MLIGTKARPTEEQIRPVISSGIKYIEAVLIDKDDLEAAINLHLSGVLNIVGLDPKRQVVWQSIYEKSNKIIELGMYVSVDGFRESIDKLIKFKGKKAIENLPATSPSSRRDKANDLDYLEKICKKINARIAFDVNHFLQSVAYEVSAKNKILPKVIEEKYIPNPEISSIIGKDISEVNYRTYFNNPVFKSTAIDLLEKLKNKNVFLNWASVGDHKYVHKGLSASKVSISDDAWTYDPPVSFNGKKMYPVTFKSHLPFGEGELYQILELRHILPYLRTMGVSGLIIETNLPFKNKEQLSLDRLYLEAIIKNM